MIYCSNYELFSASTCPALPMPLAPSSDPLHAEASLYRYAMIYQGCYGNTDYYIDLPPSCPQIRVMNERQILTSFTEQTIMTKIKIPTLSGLSGKVWFLATFSHDVASVTYVRH